MKFKWEGTWKRFHESGWTNTHRVPCTEDPSTFTSAVDVPVWCVGTRFPNKPVLRRPRVLRVRRQKKGSSSGKAGRKLQLPRPLQLVLRPKRTEMRPSTLLQQTSSQLRPKLFAFRVWYCLKAAGSLGMRCIPLTMLEVPPIQIGGLRARDAQRNRKLIPFGQRMVKFRPMRAHSVIFPLGGFPLGHCHHTESGRGGATS